MQVFFDSFGINVLSLIWYLLLFGAVLYLLRRFAFSRVVGMIDARQAEINRALDEAQEAVASVKQNRERAEKILWEAGQEAQEIVRRAERIGNDLQADARREAKLQQDVMIARARTEIEQERLQAVADIKKQVVDLALVAAGTVLRENLDAEKNRKLAEQTIQQAELRA
ncbi:MAG: F0F1 ATP synthase subunit B [Candidatus Dormibacteria bacterium]